MSRDARVDAYIDKAAPFAQAILTHFRALVHESCAEAEEAIKWGFPHFVYRSRNLASMAAFKAHASIGFWHGDKSEKDGMGDLGKLAAPGDLPPDRELAAMITKSMALIDSGAKPAWMERRQTRAPLPVPAELVEAIEANPAAAKVWAGFAPSHVREYAEWVADAKREETRARRIAEAVGWIAEGKQRHWKYQK